MTIRQILGRVLISLTAAEYADLIAAAMDVDDQLQPEHVSRPIGQLLAAHESSPLSSRPTAQGPRPKAHSSQLTAHGSDLPLVITGPGGAYRRAWPRPARDTRSTSELVGTDDLAAIAAEALPLAHG
jgi:hypothetical protein